MIKISQLTLIIIAILSTTDSYADNALDQELQQGCDKVRQYTQTGKQFYDQKQYHKAIQQFEKQATWMPFCQLDSEDTNRQITDRDVEIANNNVGLSYAKLGKPQWARVWFLRNEHSKTSQYNLKQLPPPKPLKDLQGHYVKINSFGQWDDIMITKKNQQYQITYEGYYFGLRGLIYGPNIGNFEITMPVKAKYATYQYDDCQVQLQFSYDPHHGQKIDVQQNNHDSLSCGFGHNVDASGVFYHVED